MPRHHNPKRFWLIPIALLALIALYLGVAGAALGRQPPAQIIAHRGANAYAPENTLPAFEKALALGAEGVETDILLTADGHVVLSHDDTIDRCSDGTGRVDELTLAQLRERDFGAWFAGEFAGTQIPTLEEFLDVVCEADPILIELKSNDRDIAVQTVQAVKERGLMDRVIFQSFNMEAIQACRDADGNAYIALLYSPGSEYDKAVRKDTVGFCRQYELDALHPQYAALSSGLVRRCAKIGVEVRAWTPNDALFLAGGSGQGARGLITDDIGLAQKLMRLPAFARRALGVACDVAYLLSPLFG